jgi:hypothetical protein
VIEEETSPRPSVQHSRRCLGISATLVTLALGTLFYFVRFYGPHEHDNPSFHFGQKVMTRDVYGSLKTSSVEDACRATISRAGDKPRPFDPDEAVSGCKYQEYQFDN